MKKSILALALFFSMSVLITSCKDSKKETETERTDHVVEKAEMAMNDAYICPMGCEGDKTYDKEGKCPVCKMDLKKVEKEDEHEHENGVKQENRDVDEKKEADTDAN